MKIGAVILAGGKSARMGGISKADMTVNGETVIGKIAEELSFFDEIIISSEEKEKYEKYGKVLPDIYKNRGPMGGVFTALEACVSDCLFVTACDMPLIKGETVKRLCEEADADSDAVIAVNRERIEPLFGIYSKGAAKLLGERLKAGEYSMSRALSALRVRYVNDEDITDDLNEFFNMNTPEDYYKLTGKFMRISLEEAVGLIEKNIKRKAVEKISIWDSLDRTIAENFTAKIDNPPFNRSPYDGYALKADDTPTEMPLKVIGESFAGSPAEVTVGRGEAVRIMTGGVIPEGADCVVPQEETDMGERLVMVNRRFMPFDNYIRRGEDFLEGDLLIEKGSHINASAAALAAASGNDRIVVYPEISAAVISTGDELVDVGGKLKTGQIYDTNLIYTMLKLKEIGVKTVYSASVGDDLDRLRENILAACESADMVITTGGVSVGQKDLIPKALKDIGAEIIFHGVDIKPGMPTLFAVREGIPILALSGNPFAAAVGLEVMGRPLIAGLTGNNELLPKRNEAVLANGFHKKSNTRRFVKAVERDGYVTIPPSQGNGSMKTTAECNCYIDVPAGLDELKAGDRAVIFRV